MVFKNHSKSGFFNRFPYPSYPRVYVECKNYTDDIGPNEFNQITGRVATTKSHLGILVCRRNHNRTQVLGHCRDANRDERNVVIWLEDSDIIQLLSAPNPDTIDEILLARADEVRPQE